MMKVYHVAGIQGGMPGGGLTDELLSWLSLVISPLVGFDGLSHCAGVDGRLEVSASLCVSVYVLVFMF